MNDVARCPDVDDTSDKPPPLVSTFASPGATRAATTATDEIPEWASRNQWNDWRWQVRNRLRNLEDLATRFPALSVTSDMAEAARRFPMAITPYYASLIRRLDSSDPVFQMSVPRGSELFDPPCLMDDPLAEDHDMPVPGLVHRYRDRALVIATSVCAMYCRHCTRKRVAGQREATISGVDLARITEYLSVHPEIRDVIVSGGDPFTMSTDHLERVIRAIRSVRSVDIIRVGTRTPVVLPMRVTGRLTAMLRRYHPIYVNTHFNHPAELTPDAQAACGRLADAGIPLGNQTVLLRGVNDDARVLEELFRGLVRTRVRPYYLFQCDLVRGVEHFRTPVSRGIEIMEYLRGRLSGLAIPAFVVDAPHGGGKIPLLPNYQVSVSPTHTVLRNFQGDLVAYPEPVDPMGLGPATATRAPVEGVWDLATGARSRLDRKESARRPRHRGRAGNPASGVTSVVQPELTFSSN